MKLDQYYVDPRLVALYDTDNPRAADTDFYLRLTADLNTHRILDLGCGIGLLTRELAEADNRLVTGVDPALAMLAYARQQPGAEKVQWAEGDSSVGTPNADLAIMTGNVAQVFLDDADWVATLRHLHAALRPGGHLAFESRNPERREWEGWNREATHEQIDSLSGSMECWMDVVSVADGRVHLVAHNIFTTTGEDVVVDSELHFRSRAELTASLAEAGFMVEHLYGDWSYGPFTPESRLMIFVARRR